MPNIDYNFYPALSDIMSVDDLPEILSFIKNGFEKLLGNLFFANLQSSKSQIGGGAFYRLQLLSKQKIQIGLFDTGLLLILNPDFNVESVSSFPISVSWRWQVLKYLNSFSTVNFLSLPSRYLIWQ